MSSWVPRFGWLLHESSSWALPSGDALASGVESRCELPAWLSSGPGKPLKTGFALDSNGNLPRRTLGGFPHEIPSCRLLAAGALFGHVTSSSEFVPASLRAVLHCLLARFRLLPLLSQWFGFLLLLLWSALWLSGALSLFGWSAWFGLERLVSAWNGLIRWELVALHQWIRWGNGCFCGCWLVGFDTFLLWFVRSVELKVSLEVVVDAVMMRLD